MNNVEREKKNTIISEVMTGGKVVSDMARSINRVSPSSVSKQYTEITKNTETKLVDTADRYKSKLEHLYNKNPKSQDGQRAKAIMSRTLVKKVKVAETRRIKYQSKGYRTQSITKDLYKNVSGKLTETAKSSLLGISASEKKQSNIIGCSTLLGIKNNSIGVKKIMAPGVKMAKISSKTVRNSSMAIRSLKILSIIDSENAALDVTKKGVVAFSSAVVRLIDLIVKKIVGLVIKLLMPVVPYIVMCFVPFVLFIVLAVSSNEVKTGKNAASAGGTTRNKVMERAKAFIGQDGTEIWDYYGMQGHWCCMFVWTCFDIEDAGGSFYGGGKTAYVPDVQKWALENPEVIIYYKDNSTGEIIGNPKNGQYGDIVLYNYAPYDNTSEHIAFIESHNDDGSYTTIEGNTGGTGSGYDFYTSSHVNVYPSYLWDSSAMLHMIIRPNYNGNSK